MASFLPIQNFSFATCYKGSVKVILAFQNQECSKVQKIPPARYGRYLPDSFHHIRHRMHIFRYGLRKFFRSPETQSTPPVPMTVNLSLASFQLCLRREGTVLAVQRQTDTPLLLALGCPYCRWWFISIA